MYKLYIDGGLKGNKLRFGYILYDGSAVVSYNKYEMDGNGFTNNMAEIMALTSGLIYCQYLQVKHLKVYSDSDQVVKIMNDESRTKFILNRLLFHNAKLLSQTFERITFEWISHDKNPADRIIK